MGVPARARSGVSACVCVCVCVCVCMCVCVCVCVLDSRYCANPFPAFGSACYAVTVRGSEYPKEMLAKFLQGDGRDGGGDEGAAAAGYDD